MAQACRERGLLAHELERELSKGPKGWEVLRGETKAGNCRTKVGFQRAEDPHGRISGGQRVSAEPTASRPALGLPPRHTAAPAVEAPLARMLPGHRPGTPMTAEPKETETVNKTVNVPAVLRNRARA